MEFIIPIAFFVLIGWIVKIVSDNKIRKRALENGNLNESIKHLWLKSYANKPLQDIKWVIIFCGVGIISLVAHIFTLHETIVIGLICIVIAVALLTYYLLEKHSK